jgi:hypothetical protein
LRGKTGAEILREWDAQVKEMEAQRTRDALAEINWLEGQKAYGLKSKAEIAKFAVKAQITLDRTTPEVIARIQLTVQNGTSIAIAGGRFIVNVGSAHRNEHWYDVTYDVMGEPLAPGATAIWVVPPETAKNEEADLGILTARVVSLKSPDRPTDLHDPWTGEHEHRLAMLKAFVRDRPRP